MTSHTTFDRLLVTVLSLLAASATASGQVPNDDCETAELEFCNGVETGYNTDALVTPGDAAISCGPVGPGFYPHAMWYKFVASETTAQLQVSGVIAAVYEGTCGDLVEIGCVDGTSPDTISLTDLSINQTYYVQVAEGPSGIAAQFNLTLLCPDPSICGDNSISSNPPDTSNNLVVVSDAGTGQRVFAYFETNGEPICTLRWWGDTFLDFGQTCYDNPILVEVTFHEDDFGTPGPTRCAIQTLAFGIPVAPMIRMYEVDLVAPGGCCELSTGWISVQRLNGVPTCALGWSVIETPPDSFIRSDSGQGPEFLFAAANFCAITGLFVGACCVDEMPCQVVTSGQCDALGGIFKGIGSSCDEANCGYVVLDERFAYASDTHLESVWDGSPHPVYGLDTTFGNSNASYAMPDPDASYFSRLRFEFDQDENPGPFEALVVSYDLNLGELNQALWADANHWIEIGGHSGDDYGFGSLENSISFGVISNGYANFVEPWTAVHYQGHIYGSPPAVATYFVLDDEPGAPQRASGWHTLKCVITEDVIEFYVDDVLAETRLRLNDLGYDWVRLGADFDAGTYDAWIDNVRVEMVPLEVCLGDANEDNVIDVQDLIAVLLRWESDDSTADVTRDGVVDVLDLFFVILNWGPC